MNDPDEAFYSSCDEGFEASYRRRSRRLSAIDRTNYSNEIFSLSDETRSPLTKNKVLKKKSVGRPKKIGIIETIDKMRDYLKTSNVMLERLIDLSKLGYCKIQEIEFAFQRLRDSETFQRLQDKKTVQRFSSKKRQINKKSSVDKEKTNKNKRKSTKNTKRTKIVDKTSQIIAETSFDTNVRTRNDENVSVTILEVGTLENFIGPKENTKQNNMQNEFLDAATEKYDSIYELRDREYQITSNNSQNSRVPDNVIKKYGVVTLPDENCDTVQMRENPKNNDAPIETAVEVLHASKNCNERNTTALQNESSVADDENNKEQERLDDTEIFSDNTEYVDVASSSRSNFITSSEIFCNVKSIKYTKPKETCSPLKTWTNENFWSDPDAKIPVEWLKDMEDKW